MQADLHKKRRFCFEHLLLNPETNKIYCYNKSIQVNLNPDTDTPEPIGDKYRKLFMDYEGADIEIVKE